MSKQLINVEMPDGTIIEGVPEGVTQGEVMRRYAKMKGMSATPTPAKGVDDPLREMGPREHQNALWSRFGAALEPFSARSAENAQGESSWKVPDIVTGLARQATSSLPEQWKQVQGLPAALAGPSKKLLTGDEGTRAEGAGEFLRDTVPLMYGGAKAGQAGRQALANSSIPEKLMSGAASARAAVSNMNTRVPYGKADAIVQGVKTAARPIVNTGATAAEFVARKAAGKPQPVAATFPATDDPIPTDALMQRTDVPPRSIDTRVPAAPPRPGPIAAVRPEPQKILDMGTPSTVGVAPEVNRWIGVKPAKMMRGADPGSRFVKEGVFNPDKEVMAANIEKALPAIESQMDALLKAATKKGIRIKGDTIVTDNLTNIRKLLGTPREATFDANISGLLDDIVNAHPTIDRMTPVQAQALKVHLGKSIKWTGQAAETPINKAMIEMYHDLNDAIKAKVPGIDPVQKRWGDYFIGTKSIQESMVRDAAGTGTGKMFTPKK